MGGRTARGPDFFCVLHFTSLKISSTQDIAISHSRYATKQVSRNYSLYSIASFDHHFPITLPIPFPDDGLCVLHSFHQLILRFPVVSVFLLLIDATRFLLLQHIFSCLLSYFSYSLTPPPLSVCSIYRA